MIVPNPFGRGMQPLQLTLLLPQGHIAAHSQSDVLTEASSLCLSALPLWQRLAASALVPPQGRIATSWLGACTQKLHAQCKWLMPCRPFTDKSLVKVLKCLAGKRSCPLGRWSRYSYPLTSPMLIVTKLVLIFLLPFFSYDWSCIDCAFGMKTYKRAADLLCPSLWVPTCALTNLEALKACRRRAHHWGCIGCRSGAMTHIRASCIVCPSSLLQSCVLTRACRS